VDRRQAPATDAPTTLARAAIDAAGTATYAFALEGTSAVGLTIDEARAALRVRPAALHVGSLGLVTEPIASTLATAVAETGRDTLVMVDPNCRPAAITDHPGYVSRLLALLARADIVKASVDDLAFLAPGRRPDEAARTLAAAGAGLVVVTDGPGPVRAVGPAFALVVPVTPAEVVDSVGAGDAFGGALLARIVERGLRRVGLADADAVREAVGLAIEAARVTCGRPGADPPHRGELDWPSPEKLR
jgi:fructokinase